MEIIVDVHQQRILQTYSYIIEKVQKYHALLIVTPHTISSKGVKKVLSFESPEFCRRYVIFSDQETLKAGQCIYKDEVRGLSDAFGLVMAESTGTVVK